MPWVHGFLFPALKSEEMHPELNPELHPDRGQFERRKSLRVFLVSQTIHEVEVPYPVGSFLSWSNQRTFDV
jgi:hypothetical protein